MSSTKAEQAMRTPGSWIAVKADLHGDDENRWAVCVDGDQQYFVATIENGAPGDTLETEEANARLIAASPELLASCKALLEYLIDDNPGGFLGGDGWMTQLADNAKSAIAKAGGE